MTDATKAPEVDTDLYSRQIYAMGLGAMQRMLAANVLFLGCSGPAWEIAKNVTLSGIGGVVMCDDSLVTNADLSTNCFATKEDVGSTKRSQAGLTKLAALNPSVKVSAVARDKATADAIAGELRVALVVVSDVAFGQDIIDLNAALRTRGVKMITVSMAGVFLEVINDFGEQPFIVADPGGEDPSKFLMAAAELIEKDEKVLAKITVERSDDEEDTLYTNFDAKFVAASGELADGKPFPIVDRDVIPNPTPGEPVKILIQVDVTNAPDSIRGTLKAYEEGSLYVASVVRPLKQEHKPLSEMADRPMTVFNFEFDDGLASLLFRTLRKLLAADKKPMPGPYNAGDADAFIAVAKELDADKLLDNADNLRWARLFSYTAGAQLGSFAAFIGGFVAQEVLKGVSGKFIPIEQVRFFDARLAIPFTVQDDGELKVPKDAVPVGDRYDSLVAFYGKAQTEKIKNANVFVIGAGAIGCEYLKNLALCGIGTGRRGRVTVTDNDSIERSNLSRQFLFRNEHIGQPKSVVAVAAVKNINADMKIRCLTELVHQETSDPDTGVFNARFWGQQACIATAVDNNKARTFLDDQAARYRKPLIDSGTLGPLGHVECVIPDLSPRLRDAGSEGDGGKKIPFCTLHYFPSTIQHCIQYARDLFEALFVSSAQEANKFLEAPDFQKFVDELEPGARLGALEGLYGSLVVERPTRFDDCVVWAREYFESCFVNSVADVLHSYPPELEQDGKPYWGGSRKLPKQHAFNVDEGSHSDFVIWAARLRAQLYNIECPADFNEKKITTVAARQEFPAYSPKKINIDDGKKGKKDEKEKKTEEEIDAAAAQAAKEREERIAYLVQKLRGTHANIAASGNTPLKQLSPQAFEKDDPSNGHIDVITAISNVRAATYSIPQEDTLFTKRVAGRIIPAMITTTAAVTGLATVALCNVLIGRSDTWRNFSVSVQDPQMTQSIEPNPPRRLPYFVDPSTDGEASQRNPPNDVPSEMTDAFPLVTGSFTSWERFELSLPFDASISAIRQAFAKKYAGLVITQLVEERTGAWVYNHSVDDKEKGDFPLGMWTRKLLDAPPSDDGSCSFEYVVTCEPANESIASIGKVASVLPPLKYAAKGQKDE